MDTVRRGLRVETVEKVLPHINPTRSELNCVECAMAVDDSLGGRGAVAGPTPEQPGANVKAEMSHRTVEYVADLAPAEIEDLLLEVGPGARGIVIGWKDGHRGHAFNVANLRGDVYWIEGQSGRMSAQDPYGYQVFDLYRTGGGVR
jgi:hypothetical protein